MNGKKTIQEQKREPTFTEGEILLYNTNNDYVWISANSNHAVVKVIVVGNNADKNKTNCKVKIIETYSKKEEFQVGKEIDAKKEFLLTNENFQLWMTECLP